MERRRRTRTKFGTTLAVVCSTFWMVVTAYAGEGSIGPASEDPVLSRRAALRSLELAVRDLVGEFAPRYPRGSEFLDGVAALDSELADLEASGESSDQIWQRFDSRLDTLRSEALFANPLLDFGRLLFVKRRTDSPGLGLPANWQGNCSLPRSGFDDEIAVLAALVPDAEIETLYHPGGKFVGDVELHWDGERMLFSSTDDGGRWQVFEIRADGSGLRQRTYGEDDVDNYDACYLPSGDLIFSSTAPFIGVPCVKGSSHVANLFLLEPDRTGTAKPERARIRQLTFDQDHDWCPTVLPNGRVLYLRWEYSDLPHFVSRILFHMNPDGTDQAAYYGSNSYWPNSVFYARPLPGDSAKFTGVVTGHHGAARMGELVLFDTARGRREATGAVQRIPGRGKKVHPILRDRLVDESWPKFLHPFPLSEKYFLVSAKPTPKSHWGIYLVDVFDNTVLVAEDPRYAFLEPVPLRASPTPPVIPSRVDPNRDDAIVYLADVHAGAGLEGVPRGTVKKLRLFTYHFAYHGMGGQVNRVGIDGPWDIKRVLGTVPVHEDGSARFRVPANTPLSVQPLDAEGKALQLMRSWMTAMPGETLSCVGCHESHDSAPANRDSLAYAVPPSKISPWYGPTRGFSFEREVQPVLDRFCVACHDGRALADGLRSIDFRARPAVPPPGKPSSYVLGSRFSPSYLALRSFVRAPTIESDMHLLTPLDFHADTTRLIQLLRKGHRGVRLDDEAWDRLVTWIDLNTPFHGTWGEIVGEKKVAKQRERRREMLARFAGREEDPEAIDSRSSYSPKPIEPRVHVDRRVQHAEEVVVDAWPFDRAEAVRRQSSVNRGNRSVDLGDGVRLDLVYVPSGAFAMGSSAGHADEMPVHRVEIDRSFWMGRLEVTNEQYRRFDASHDSRLEHGDFLHFSGRERGYTLREPRQPVVRVSWDQALEFCRWLSQETGETFTLPTEAEWEYACRAGTATSLSFGEVDSDFSRFANLADASFQKVDLFDWGLPLGAIPEIRPAVARFDDGARVSSVAGEREPNAWGLHDMHGNVAEWTFSHEAAYPFRSSDRCQQESGAGRRVVRGGSWYDRPRYATSSYRGGYHRYQRVFDVGFRVVVRAER